MKPEELTFEYWAELGWLAGWCSPPVCVTHDGLPTSDEEEEQMMDGDDICVHVIRLYDSGQQASQVIDANPAVAWRATNRGWNEIKKQPPTSEK